MDKAEIEKILEELYKQAIKDNAIPMEGFKLNKLRKERCFISSSSLTTLIIKWLETNIDYGKELDNDTIVRNQLITELIGEVR